jgi:hypothetical protein
VCDIPLIEKYELQSLISKFNEYEDSIRIVVIVSPTCPDCVRGFEVIKNLFLRFDSKKLRGFVTWVSMLSEDDEEAARKRSDSFSDQRVTQYWDYDRSLARLFAKALHFQRGVAWDVYLLYSPRIIWGEGSELEPPEPAFWMHQLDSEPAANQSKRLDPSRFGEEAKFLLEAEDPELFEREDVAEVLLKKGEKKNSREK